MTEYIEREAVENMLKESQLISDADGEYCGYCTEDISIDSIPASDVAPVRHGRWIYDGGNEYVDHYHCDRCGQEIDLCNEIYTEPKPNYCKNCGSKMDKETSDEQ